MRVRPAIVVLLMMLSFSVVALVPTMLGVERVAISQTVDVTARKTELQRQAEQLLPQGAQQYQEGKTTEALQIFEQAIVLFRQLGDVKSEVQLLGWMGMSYNRLGNPQKALELHQQALTLARRIGDRLEEGAIFHNIGRVYDNLGQYDKALGYYQQALVIRKAVQDRQGEGSTLNNIGLVYNSLGQYDRALEYYLQALAILKAVRDRRGEGATLHNIGSAYHKLGQYDKALEYLQQALVIAKAVQDRPGESATLNSIGLTYHKLGQYDKALEYLQQGLSIVKAVQDRQGEGRTLNNIGLVYNSLGQYDRALEYYQQTLVILKAVRDRQGEGTTLNNIGEIYRSLGEYDKALEYYRQALVIRKAVRDRQGESETLNSIGAVCHSLGQYDRALEYYQQALVILKAVRDRQGEGTMLHNIGAVYNNLRQHNKALEYYQQALVIRKAVRDRPGEGVTLNNIGYTLEAQKQTELAIVFYKQSVNVYESIRDDIRKLSKEQQESYTKTVEKTYRILTDLLLSQGRVLEAQQVLELLKIQELRGYTRNARAGGGTRGAPLNSIEKPIIFPYNNLIVLGKQLTDCESKRPFCAERDRLIAQRTEADKQFQQQVDQLRKLSRNQDRDPAQLQQEELTIAAQKVILAQPNTVLIYPLVLEDKLWLVWGTQAGKRGVVFDSKEIPVSRAELSKTVAEFRSLLSKRGNLQQLKQVSQKLYGWLIEPIRAQLDQNGIQNVVFSLDRSTRYIPMQALFDGKQYLIENFGISTILTAGLTDTSDHLSSNVQDNLVLGLGLSDRTPNFDPLPNVKTEIDAIVRTASNQGIFPGLEFFNRDFSKQAIQKHLIDHRILHIATHGKFVPGNPEDSFLVLGTGERLQIPDIQTLKDLAGVHLVVLSACQTAEGGQDKEGIEVSGISYYFLTTGAKSVMGSLWLVNDASTSLLMQEFYRNLATGKMTKTAAMREAQRRFIQRELTAKNAPARSDVTPISDASVPRSNSPEDYSHPYYWSPFILIGNGL